MKTMTLACARAELGVATAAVEVASANVAVLRGRSAEAAKRRADALAALRAGDLTEVIAAARMAVADADAADLQVLIATAEAAVAKSERERTVAQSNVDLAQRHIDHGERAEKIRALDAFIADAEAKFVRAIELRHDLGAAQSSDRMLSAHWRPSGALSKMVRYGRVPKEMAR